MVFILAAYHVFIDTYVLNLCIEYKKHSCGSDKSIVYPQSVITPNTHRNFKSDKY